MFLSYTSVLVCQYILLTAESPQKSKKTWTQKAGLSCWTALKAWVPWPALCGAQVPCGGFSRVSPSPVVPKLSFKDINMENCKEKRSVPKVN